ncbi:UTP--glucose-1-phosphate uridylyltransferase [Botrimarina hoheduenensis]|uniref:Putative uridylyltransferase n=1 Tax=Botrimarina hoheduenensis TaxID=2528000 RepID=A0A5C5WE80_9BACT|nr:UTP--glucose-1-phosphate uridylyltransferase [Botrimarina hoheduenensis]TWT48369.1 putative uridylyltransferase [Botrimarina hoheduenensis]
MPAPASLAARLAPSDQLHLVRWWDELAPAAQERLRGQIEAIDFEQLGALHQGQVDQPDWHAAARRAQPPVAMRLADRLTGGGGGLGVKPPEAIAAGKAALDAGRVGVLLVAGGQGSRLGFEKPKGMYPIGPVSDATLLQIHLEKAVALAKRHGKGVPVYLMTSPITHEEQIAFLEANDRFGLAEDDLFVFCQGTMPAVDEATGRVLMSDRGELFLSPDGHGGTIAALAAYKKAGVGAIDHMRRRGVEHLFYLQVDNPLVPIGDAEFLGYHLAADSELTSMAVAKSAPEDKLGNFVMVDNELCVIEYSDFPDDVAAQADAEGGLRFWAGSIAVHVFGVAFLERMLALKDALPFHVAHKKAPYLDESGQLVTPTENNALKFERFIFDLLPKAKRPIVVEYAESEVFAPLKNASGAPKDTPEYVRQFLLDQQRSWLQAAGVAVPADVPVEISPLWGLDAAGVAERAAQAPVAIEGPTYLRG